MNKTVTFVALAAGLALIALVLGLPQAGPLLRPAPGPAPTPPRVDSRGSLTLTSRLSHPYIPTGSSEVFVTVDLTGAEVPGSRRTPVNLALVIDRSGSMSGDKLAYAKQAARHLVGQLRESDRLAIVHYGTDVRSKPSLPATPANRQEMLEYIDAILDEGGTNIEAGLSSGLFHVGSARGGYDVNRIILISDGQPTEGAVEPEELVALVKRIRAQGIAVSSIGVGTDFNEDLMAAFAEFGAGAYGFLEHPEQLSTLFQKDLQKATTLVARNVELTFELPEGTSLGEVLGYRAWQQGRVVHVPLPDFSAGQVERVVARLEVQGAAHGKQVEVAGLRLAYADLLSGKQAGGLARLTAEVTSDFAQVTARQDKDATVYKVRAQSAKNVQLAADALRAGRKEEAKGYLQQNLQLLQGAAAVASPAAVAEDVAAQEALLEDYERAESSDEVGAAVKRSKAKARRDFGQLGSTY